MLGGLLPLQSRADCRRARRAWGTPDGAPKEPTGLEEAVARLDAAGVEGEWFDDSYGHGRAYRYTGPGGRC